MTVLSVFLSGKSPNLGLVSFGREMEGLTGSVVDDSIGTFLLNSRSMLRLIRLKYVTDIETDLLFVAAWSPAYCPAGAVTGRFTSYSGGRYDIGFPR